MYIHKQTNIDTYTHIHTHIHAYIHTYIHTYIYTLSVIRNLSQMEKNAVKSQVIFPKLQKLLASRAPSLKLTKADGYGSYITHH